MTTTLLPTRAQIGALAAEYALEAESDYVGLWQICTRVRHDLAITDPDELRSTVMQVIDVMLAMGLLAVDLPSEGPGRRPWQDQARASVLARIRSEWQALGRDPSVGDIVWFDNPDRGTAADARA